MFNHGLLKTVDQETASDLVDFVRREEILEIGCDDWLEACGQGYLEYQECEGNYFNEWKRGYSVLFDLLMVLGHVSNCLLIFIFIFNYFFFHIEKHSKGQLWAAVTAIRPHSFEFASCCDPLGLA